MSYIDKIKVSDFTIEMVQKICDCLNRGHQVEIKREAGGKVIIVDIIRNKIK